MQLIIIISMIFALLIAIFAIQNASVITINFLWYEKNMSQALVILGSTLVGILIMLPFDIIRRIKTSIKINELNNRIRKLNEELEQIKQSKESLDKKGGVQYDTNKNNE
ncbi:MAG TPA: LapA family protein [Clostridiales bacterium]|nr:LapA family protein [Clostridiales bacterium]